MCILITQKMRGTVAHIQIVFHFHLIAHEIQLLKGRNVYLLTYLLKNNNSQS